MNSKSGFHKITVSIILKMSIIVFSIVGVIIAYSGNRAYMGGGRAFMYFTIQSNIALAIINAIDIIFVIKKDKDIKPWFIVRFMGVVSITLTGAVFCLFLAPTFGGYVLDIQNIITHMIVPFTAIVEFLLTETHSNNLTCSSLWGTLPSLAYAAYAGIGFINKWEFAVGVNYPYAFLNWGSPAGALGFSKDSPFLGCVWWIFIAIAFIILIGRVYTRILISLRQLKPEK